MGEEIYGAGESVWLYLMFEALGQVSDRELMMVNLHPLDIYDLQQFPPRRLSFIPYNPTDVTRSAVLAVPPAQGAAVRWSENGKAVHDTVTVPAKGILRLVADL